MGYWFWWRYIIWRTKFLGQFIIIGICCVCMIIFGLYFLQYGRPVEQMDHELRQFQYFSLTNYSQNFSSEILEKLIEAQRIEVENQLTGAVLRSDLYGNLSRNDYLSKFTLEKGGTPLRILLVSNRRSGSTFTERLLSSIPGLIAYFEPVLCIMSFIGPMFIQDGSILREEAVLLLKDLFQCNTSAMHCLEDLGFRRTPVSKWMTGIENNQDCNIRLAPYYYCRSAPYLKATCQMAPFLAIKEVHMALKYTEELLQDNSFNLKVIYLIRDPRGVMNSRYNKKWKGWTKECLNPEVLCSRTKDDFETTKLFTRKYPDKFRVFRYEDITLDPLGSSERLMHFLGFEMHSSIVNFVKKETRSNPFHWRRELSLKQVLDIQKACDEAMYYWGYNLVTSQKNLNDSNFKLFKPKWQF